jgi:monoamine oxidase
VHTLRTPFSDGLYGEAGAMRFPTSHRLLLAYLDRFGIATRRFSSFNPDGLFHFGGSGQRMSEAFADPNSAANRVRRLWLASLEPLVRLYRMVAAEGGNAWPALVEDYNEMTLRDFLVECGWSEEDILALGLIGLGMGDTARS